MTQEFKTFSVVWTLNVDAPNAEEAARHAQEIQRKPDSWATFFHVKEDLSFHLTDTMLQERYGYECIDLDTVAANAPEEVGARVQRLLCSPWSVEQPAEREIPAFLLKHQPETYMEIVIVDPQGVAVITHCPI